MKCENKMMVLYAVTDRRWNSKTLYEQVEKALCGGVTCVQLREKDMNEIDFLNEAIQINKLCKMYNVPFLVNDNINIAMRCGADGIHVGQEDMPVKEVRSLVGENMIIGVSVHNVDEAIKAVEDGADYIGIGAIFDTSTKHDAKNISLSIVSEVCKAVDVPVVAIGGLNKYNIKKLKGTGINGVALVSAIFASEDIEKSCKELYKISKKVVYDN